MFSARSKYRRSEMIAYALFGWASRIRSISFVEMRRSAAIILNEALIFAHQVFGR